MISSDRRAWMMLSWAMDGGDLAVAELVQLGPEDWAKIIEGARWESRPLSEPSASRSMLLREGPKLEGPRVIVPGDDEWPTRLDDLRAESIQRPGLS